ncbi:hypothetical protein [Plasticicumulans acidivorans]|nr:hypothetical protein [Plasticicumulans acidivorans]
MFKFSPDTKQLCVLVFAALLAVVSLFVPLDDHGSQQMAAHTYMTQQQF